MALFLITYDLIKTKDYPKLHNAIKKIGSYKHILESSWVVESSSTNKEIRDYCKGFMDSDEKLFVAKLTGGMAWKQLDTSTCEWLLSH